DKAPVPEKIYEVPIGKAAFRRKGKDLSIIACSYLAREAEKAAAELEKSGVDAEVLDLRTVKPLDRSAIVATARRTGRVLIADGGWKSFGVSAEVAALVAESGAALKAPLKRLALPDCPAPASVSLEKAYYLHAEHIAAAALGLLRGKKAGKVPVL
ncbi:MAG TPA: transketolase C-terminal domain-containing protein, partial [Elusimicrobiales bacterium]|nr:transketolase C-terminal domain-containing protein [Elusimicrobiales bacterium]